MYRHPQQAALLALFRQKAQPCPVFIGDVEPPVQFSVPVPAPLAVPAPIVEEKGHVADCEEKVAPVPAGRIARAWKKPKELGTCPFDADHPCCTKPTPCYEYFGDEVKTWRRANLFDSTESEDTTRERLRKHRNEHLVPTKKEDKALLF